MWFCVRVPVLSVQITVVEPSVSTEGRWRISTLRLAMRWVASTSARVRVGSRPSGTIATMMPMAKMKDSQKETPIAHQLTAKNNRPMESARMMIKWLR